MVEQIARDIAAALNERFAGEVFFGDTSRVKLEMNAFLAVEYPGWSVDEIAHDGSPWCLNIRIIGPSYITIELVEHLR